MEEINWSESEPHPFKKRQTIKTYTPEEIERAKQLAEIITRKKIEENRKRKKMLWILEKLKGKIMRRKNR